MANNHVLVGSICADCNQCCGGYCADPFASCREACSPCCTASVQFLGSLDNLPALSIVATQTETSKVGLFDPEENDGLEIPVGLLMHPVNTDTSGNITNFRNALVAIPGCGEKTGVVFTSGEFLEAELVAQNSQSLVEAMLAVPNFAKRIAGGYIRIL